MATVNFTTLLGLALPTSGDLEGTWGDEVNNKITSLLDSAVAGTTTISTDADVTLTSTEGAANQARQPILLCTGARTAIRTITAPATSKYYVVINNTTGGFGVTVVGVGPTAGVTVEAGDAALIAWGGSGFVLVGVTAAATMTLTNKSLVDASTYFIDNADGTKKVQFQLSGITTGTTRTATFPNANFTIAGINVSGQAFTTAQTFRAANAVRSEVASTQDAMVLAGRGGGTGSYAVTLTPTTLTASRTATFPNASITVAGTDLAQTFTASQRGTITTDNDLSFDLNAANNFTCTPSAGGTLTFTNITAGQSGFIKLVNGSNYAISAAATTKVTSTFLATISATGTYIISYYSDGTNVYCATAGAMA